MKDKIIFFSPYYDPESFPHNALIDELANRGNNVSVITSLPNYRKYGFYKGFSIVGPYFEKKKNLKIFRLPVIPRLNDKIYSIFFFYLSFFITSFIFLFFFSILYRNKYNYLISFCGSPVYTGIYGNIFSKLINAKHLLWVQDIWPEAIQTTQKKNLKYAENLINFFQSWMWNKADVLLSQSNELNNFLKQNSFAKENKILFNPVREVFDSEKMSEIDKGKKNKTLVITYMGAIGAGKFLNEIIDSILLYKNSNIELNLCGTGSEYESLKKKYVSNRIKWHGWLAKKELDQISLTTDFFIFGLNTLNRQSLILPSKLQTYCMYGKPIICYSDGASKSFIKNNNLGIVCDKKDKKSLVDAIHQAALIDKLDRLKMGKSAREYFNNNFTREKVADQCEEIFRDLREEG